MRGSRTKNTVSLELVDKCFSYKNKTNLIMKIIFFINVLKDLGKLN